MTIRSFLYALARLLGDIQAVQKGTIAKRLERRIAGRVVGKLMGRIGR